MHSNILHTILQLFTSKKLFIFHAIVNSLSIKVLKVLITFKNIRQVFRNIKIIERVKKVYIISL